MGEVGILFILLFALVAAGVPVCFSIAASTSIFLMITNMKPLLIVSQRMITGLDSFPLLAIPLFILVGNLMDVGGISKRLVKWADSLVGNLPGGLGIVAIISCTVFAALTGSGPATVAAIGSIMVPSMVEGGYSKRTAGGLCAAAGALGPIIPPSIPMIVFGVTMGVSIPAEFLGGIVPGIIIALLLVFVNVLISKRDPDIMAHRKVGRFSFSVFLRNTWSSIPALLLPVIVLGGIYGGIFTPTEAGAVGVVYSIIVGFLYKELRFKDFKGLFIRSCETSAMVCFIMAVANILSWIMAATQVTNSIVGFLMTFITDKYTYLLVLNLFLLVVGALLDTGAAIIIFCPILFSLGISLGLEPLHLALVMVINLVIGYVTPPFGYNLFTACSITGLKFGEIVKGVLPFLLVEVGAVFLFAYCPILVTWLPSLFGY